jgi:hypothetical protein
VKTKVEKLTNEELFNFPLENIVPDWYFRIEEISQNYFRVTGTDSWGRLISRDGVNPEVLLSECKLDILSKKI